MSLHDDLTAVRRNLNELVRSVERLERDVEDAARQAPAAPRAPRQEGMVQVPDTPYDSSLWTDADDEGLGSRGRRAP
ncbi:hypothetical protein EDE04_2507 [Streptomyces sp. 2132.2]|uniref:Uncharacterized protein n=1 Tax=Streptomyces vinaceus TaxID=1960 RepID=A0A5J6JDQ8_STRVI|nr:MULTISPECIES: hypothetical protein [Streptomyces]QEV45728.1 hypothetical protein CP980_12115 [Streptomyces vinaceus]ROQ96050.1 hypothetical protein EDE04_2507 [Streptomyces sp. 2132.2]GHE32968.1 hypothetical protein GCM10017778_14720 [Streptomyces vinaceus]